MDPDRSATGTPERAPQGKPAAESNPSGVSGAPEHDWPAAAARLFPVLRPAGMLGTRLDALAAPDERGSRHRTAHRPGPRRPGHRLRDRGARVQRARQRRPPCSLGGLTGDAARGGLREPRHVVVRGAVVGGGRWRSPDPLV